MYPEADAGSLDLYPKADPHISQTWSTWTSYALPTPLAISRTTSSIPRGRRPFSQLDHVESLMPHASAMASTETLPRANRR